MSKEMIFNFEQYTTIGCKNIKCKHHRRYLGDMNCNCKYIVITEEGKCYYLENKEERIEHQSNK